MRAIATEIAELIHTCITTIQSISSYHMRESTLSPYMCIVFLRCPICCCYYFFFISSIRSFLVCCHNIIHVVVMSCVSPFFFSFVRSSVTLFLDVVLLCLSFRQSRMLLSVFCASIWHIRILALALTRSIYRGYICQHIVCARLLRSYSDIKPDYFLKKCVLIFIYIAINRPLTQSFHLFFTHNQY